MATPLEHAHMILVHLIDWEVATNVGIEYKESRRMANEYLIPEVIDSTSSSQTTMFLKISATVI